MFGDTSLNPTTLWVPINIISQNVYWNILMILYIHDFSGKPITLANDSYRTESFLSFLVMILAILGFNWRAAFSFTKNFIHPQNTLTFLWLNLSKHDDKKLRPPWPIILGVGPKNKIEKKEANPQCRLWFGRKGGSGVKNLPPTNHTVPLELVNQQERRRFCFSLCRVTLWWSLTLTCPNLQCWLLYPEYGTPRPALWETAAPPHPPSAIPGPGMMV